MAYMCYKPAGSCSTCEHYRYDEDSQGKACFAQVDEDSVKEKYYVGTCVNCGAPVYDFGTYYKAKLKGDTVYFCRDCCEEM